MIVNGSEDIRVNTHRKDDQSNQQIAALADGGWVVTWQSPTNRGDGRVDQQVYAADGTPAGGEVVVGDYGTTINSPSNQLVRPLAGGGWVVVWASHEGDGEGWNVYQRAYAADGSAIGNPALVNTTTAKDQESPQVAALADGGWVVTWQSRDGNDSNIYQQVYSASGAPANGEVRISTDADGDQFGHDVTALTGGGWVVTWTAWHAGGTSNDVYQQIYAADGTALNGEVRVNTTTDGDQAFSQITALDNGGWVVTWTTDGDDDLSFGDPYQQLYSSDGTPMSGEVFLGIGDDASGQTVTALKGGGWLVAETVYKEGGEGSDIYQQAFAANGDSLTDMMRVNSSDGREPDGLQQVAALSDGGWVVAWEGGSKHGFYLRAFAADGIAETREIRIDSGTANNQGSPHIAALADGGWVVTWTAADGSGSGVYQKYFSGGAGDVPFSGTSGNDAIRGDEENNVINGAGGNDSLVGHEGNDTLRGNAGHDMLRGGIGEDKLHGGAGADTFVFATGDSGKWKSTADTIFDFEASDTINLAGWDANANKPGNSHFSYIGADDFTGHAGELHYVEGKSDTWIEGDTDGDGKADFTIHLDDAVDLTRGNFHI